MASTTQRSVTIETSTVLKIVLILLALGFLYLIRDILALIFVALFLAALMHPAARALARFHIPKGLTVICLYLALFGGAVLLVSLLLPPLIEQGAHLFSTVGKSVEVLSGSVQSLKEFSLKYGLSANLQAGVQSLQVQLANAATGLFSTLTEVFGGVLGLIVVLVMAYYMVVQEEEARRLFRNSIPEKYQTLSIAIIQRVEEKMGRWLLGQIALCVIIGLLYFIGLSAIGINSALVLAVFGGFTEFIPYLGPILGAIPVIVLALSDSSLKAMLAAGVLVAIQQLEGHLIVPQVMQKAVGLNPLVSIVSLLVGAKLFGIVGVLLAIPVATALSVVIDECLRHLRAQQSRGA